MGGWEGTSENELAQDQLYPKILPEQAVHSPSWKVAVSFCHPFALQLKQQQLELLRVPGLGKGLLQILERGSFYEF